MNITWPFGILQCQNTWLPLGHITYTNNLPLALEPITAVSQTHLLKMSIKLHMSKHFSQWISDIVNWSYLSDDHIALANKLSDNIINPFYVFGFLVRPRFLCQSNGSIAVTKRGISDTTEGTTPNWEANYLIQTASLAASNAAKYLASVVESAVTLCLELFQLTAPPLQMKTNPKIDFLSLISD